jgi:O-antigen/teichoic acid export membrane protein
MLKSFLKDSVIYTIPSIVSRGLSLFLVPLYTKVLAPADYGALDLFMVFVNIINLTIALEISQAVARFYTADKSVSRKISYASTAFWFTIIIYFTFNLIFFIFSKPLTLLVIGQSDLENVFKIGLLHIFLYGLIYLMQNQLRWELRSKAFALLSLVYVIATTIFSLWFAYYNNQGIIGLMWGMVGGGSITILLGFWLLRKTIRFEFNENLLKEMLSFSAPLVPASIAVWVSSYVDRMMINHFLGLTEVGIYGIGFRLASIVSLVMVGFQMALTPLIYTHHEEIETPNEIARIFRLFIAFCLLFFLFMNLFVSDLLKIFTQPEFYDARFVIIYLVPAIIFSQIYIFAPGIQIAKKTSYVVWINVLGAILNIILNLLLIPLLSYKGSALATLISQAMVFFILMYYSQRFYPIPYQWFKLFIATCLSIAIVLIAQQINIKGIMHYILSLGFLTAVLLSFVGLGLIQKNEIKSFNLYVKNLLKK